MSIQSIVRYYSLHIRPHANAELNWFKQQPTLEKAIYFAALAINSDGKRYSHQRRLRQTALKQAHKILQANRPQLEQCKDFDELYSLLERLLIPIKGIGELYVYDTALRIGAKLGLLPQKVYLHAGTRIGAQALGFDGKSKALDVSQLPIELHQLEPHEIEDVLCIFKDKLMKLQVITQEDIVKRSWCD